MRERGWVRARLGKPQLELDAQPRTQARGAGGAVAGVPRGATGRAAPEPGPPGGGGTCVRGRRGLPGARGAGSAESSPPPPLTFGSAPGPRAVSRQRTPPAAAPCPTFCEFAVAISQSRTRKEPLTKLNGPALFCSRYLNAALCFFLVGLLCQITLFLKTRSGFCDTASAQHGVRPAHSRRSVNVF